MEKSSTAQDFGDIETIVPGAQVATPLLLMRYVYVLWFLCDEPMLNMIPQTNFGIGSLALI